MPTDYKDSSPCYEMACCLFVPEMVYCIVLKDIENWPIFAKIRNTESGKFKMDYSF